MMMIVVDDDEIAVQTVFVAVVDSSAKAHQSYVTEDDLVCDGTLTIVIFCVCYELRDMNLGT